jgi:hypothetical protein
MDIIPSSSSPDKEELSGYPEQGWPRGHSPRIDPDRFRPEKSDGDIQGTAT